jgi:hypothetical protein
VGVALAGALIWWKQDDVRWHVADPICTFLFSLLVLLTTRGIIRDIMQTLMERSPSGLDIASTHRAMHGMEGVSDVHDLHVWNISTGGWVGGWVGGAQAGVGGALGGRGRALVSPCSAAAGCRLLAAGCWLLAAGWAGSAPAARAAPSQLLLMPLHTPPHPHPRRPPGAQASPS